MSTVVAVMLFVAVTAYAVFGGADFGAGFWDLVAGGAARGDRPREVIDHSIGPVWEANHVWLIFCFVVLWTGFSEAYASITLTLFVPLTLAALGIVLRGSSFAFRKTVFRTRDRRNFGARLRHLVGARARTAWARSPAPSPRAGCRPAARPATRGRAGSTRRRSSAACSRSSSSPTSPPSTSSGTPGAWPTSDGRRTSAAGRWSRPSSPVSSRSSASSSCAPTPDTCSTG